MVKIIDGEVVQDDDPRLKKAFKMPTNINWNKAGLILFLAYIVVLNLPKAINSAVGGGGVSTPGEVREVFSLPEATRLLKYHKTTTGSRSSEKGSRTCNQP